jgi:hypothetical protein
VAYRADIEIGVRGARDLEQLRSAINQTARAVDSLNEVVGQRGRLVQSIQNYTSNLDRAAQSLKRVGAGTEAETKAVREYVQILGQATTARERQNNLIEEQIRLQQTAARTAKLTAGGVRENPKQYAGPIGPGPASPVALSSKLYGRLEQAIEAQVTSLTSAAKQLNLKSSWSTFFEEAAQLATELKQTAAAKQLNLKSSWSTFFEEAAQLAVEIKAAAQRASAEIRASEGAASAAARERLAAAATERRAGVSGVVTRPIVGAAYATPAGPGGSGVTRASAVAASAAVERQVAQVRRTEAQAELKIVKDRGVAENYISGVINRRLAAKAQELALEKQQTAEVQKRAASERRKRAENVLIGGAFPMLFGAGPGAVLGGAAGGLIPGNPMLSVATSALGAVLDQFAAQATELGKSLQDPIKNFDALKEASLLASGNQERYIQKLIESGKVAEAQAAIQAELFKKVSTQGVADLQNLGAASTKLSRAWAEFNLQLQTAIAGPMAGLLSWLAGIVNISNEVSRKNAATESFLTALSKNPKQYQAYLRESSAMAAANGGRVNEAAVQALRERYMPGGVPTGTNLSAASQETVQLEKAKTSELKAQVDLAAKQLSLAGVDININREGYSVRAKQVALQEYENRLLEIKNSFIGKAFDAERNTLMIREANLNYAAKLNNIDAQVRESAARAAKKAADDAARIAEQALQSRVKLTQELYQAEKASYDIAAQNAEIFTGPVSGLKQRIADTENVQYLDFMILSLEKQQALIEAQKLGTASLVNDVYDRRLKNLNQQYAVQKAQNQLEINRINLQRQQTVVDQQRGRDTQLRGIGRDTERLSLETTLIPGSPRLEKELQLLQQRNRTYDELAPTYERIADLQRQIASNSLTDEDLAIAQTSLSQEQAHLTQLQEELQLRSQLEQLLLRQNQLMQQYGNLVVNELSTAMSSAITAVVTGTGTVQEAFATMFQNIGKAFIDMATQMIAQALVMKVLGILGNGITSGGAGAFSGNASIGEGGGFGSFSGGAFGSGGVPELPGLGGAGALPDAGMYAGVKFAEGGFVTGPTRALVGEGGEAEYVIPASKMRGAMSRYAAGARGSSVIPGAGGDTEAGGTATMAPAAIDVRYSVERINSVDYVTADQFQMGMAQAAQQGAVQGEQRAMRSLKTSAATRRSVGV